MPSFVFDKKIISQHIVKYGVDVRPTLVLKSEIKKLTSYCQWLTDTFPEVFETVLSGPKKLLIQKVFSTSQNTQIELPTFSLVNRGPVYSFPIRIPFVDIEDFDLPDKDRIFSKSLKKLRSIFADRRIPRVGVVNEIVFDCGNTDSVEILSDALSKSRWKKGVSNIKIHVENPRESNNVNIDISPVRAQRLNQSASGTTFQNVGFGISVKIDINNQDMTGNLTETEIMGILGFSESYLNEEFYQFLNNEECE